MADATVLVLDDATLRDAVAAEPLPLVIDFWAPWCGPCKAMTPVIEQLAKDMAGVVRFAKLDIQASPGAAGQFGVMSVPTFVVLKGGQKVGAIVGAIPNKADFRKKIEALAGA